MANVMTKIKAVIQQPQILAEACHYYKNDILSFLKVYKYDYPIIFIAGLPKSGTTWLTNMLATIPGYNIRKIVDPQKVTVHHDITDSVFSSLPRHGYSTVKLHTKYSQENFEVINKYVPKFIVTIRDLRDMCVSRYFHIKAFENHELHRLYNSLSTEDGISHSIDFIGAEYVSWVQDWVNISKREDGRIILIKYEDLNTDPVFELKKIASFYNFQFSEEFLESLAGTKLSNQQDLAKNLGKFQWGRLTTTARKGVIGDWKNHFTDQHKDEFKEKAGKLLIELGYEKDNNW